MKSTSTAFLSVLIFSALSAGCTEQRVLSPDIEPQCAKPLACQVSGVDLVVEPIQLVVPAGQRMDAVRGMPVFLPNDSVSFVVKVWNRGDTTSPVDTLEVWPLRAHVPALAPGEAFVDTLHAQLPGESFAGFQTDTLRFDARFVEALRDDPAHSNDSNVSATFVIAAPVLRATLVTPDTLRESVPFAASISIVNESRFADLTPRSLAFCLIHYDVGCGSWAGAPFNLMEVPTIRAGETWSVPSMSVTMPPIDDRYYAEFTWSLVACIAPPGSTLLDMMDWSNRICIPEWRTVDTRAS